MNSLKVNFLTTVLILFLSSLTIHAAENSIHIEINSGSHVRQQCVVSFKLPPNFFNDKYFSLVRIDDNKNIPVQVETTQKNKSVFWILEKDLPAETTRKYKLQAVKEPIKLSKSSVTLHDDGNHIRFKIGNKPVLVYNHAIVKSPIPNQPYYARSGYIHPLYTPSGKIITDDFNPDHAHQHGIMFSWRKIFFDGRTTNTWEQKNKLGEIKHKDIISMTNGPVFGKLMVQLHHDDLTASQGSATMLNETWEIRVYNFTDHFLYDIVSTQICATEKPVLLKKIHYGGMTIRGSADWHGIETFDFLTSDGKTRKDGNHTRPNWVEIYGLLKNEPSGVVIFDHPGNFRFPQPVRLHPHMPYFCFAPAQMGEFQIDPHKPFVSKYRYYVHSEKSNANNSNRVWEDYAFPLKVQISKQ